MSINLFICDEKYSQHPYLDFKDFNTSQKCASQLARYKKTSLVYSLVFIAVLQIILYIQGTISTYQLFVLSVIVGLIYILNQYDSNILVLTSILTLTAGLSCNTTSDMNFILNLPSFLICKY